MESSGSSSSRRQKLADAEAEEAAIRRRRQRRKEAEAAAASSSKSTTTASSSGSMKGSDSNSSLRSRERRALDSSSSKMQISSNQSSTSVGDASSSSKPLAETSPLSHEQEIERIREARARRLRDASEVPPSSEEASVRRRRMIEDRIAEGGGDISVHSSRRRERTALSTTTTTTSTTSSSGLSPDVDQILRERRARRALEVDSTLSSISTSIAEQRAERERLREERFQQRERERAERQAALARTIGSSSSSSSGGARRRIPPARTNSAGEDDSLVGGSGRRIPTKVPTKGSTSEVEEWSSTPRMTLEQRRAERLKRLAQSKAEGGNGRGTAPVSDKNTRVKELLESASNLESMLHSQSSGHLHNSGSSTAEKRRGRRPGHGIESPSKSEEEDKPFELELESETAVMIPELEFCPDELSKGLDPYSLQVSIVSAVDLPLHMVPNTPLAPVIKVGIVKIPKSDESASHNISQIILEKLGDKGIEGLHGASLRATTPKILSKRDNGSVDFLQAMRWDDIKYPDKTALVLDVCVRSVRPPKNFQESPPALGQHRAFQTIPPASSASGSDDEGTEISLATSGSGEENPAGTGLRGLWRKATNRKAQELEAANAAAAVARMLIDDKDKARGLPTSPSSDYSIDPSRLSTTPQTDYNVALQPRSRSRDDMTEDVRLGSLVIPLAEFSLERVTKDKESVHLEQWYQLETSEDYANNPLVSTGRRKKPSILLKFSFSPPANLDEHEEEYEEPIIVASASQEEAGSANSAANMIGTSFSRRASYEANALAKEKDGSKEESGKSEDPVLEPGVIDYICIVGCKDIGNQNEDNGSNGWIDSFPTRCVLEQFPPNDEFHLKNKRTVNPPNMLEWFSFPEGMRLWRGDDPPTPTDLNLQRFSGSAPPNLATSVAAFDACLNCTTSFSWYVIATNSDDYGSKLVKTYGACLRFYVPAPAGSDPKYPDASSLPPNSSSQLWVPLAICLTCNLPIVGVMEAILLRLCEELMAKVRGPLRESKLDDLQAAISHLIVNFQKPIAGAVNCSIPFLNGERFLLSLPPPNGLPALPHGQAVLSVCRLLGAEGLNYLLAAILAENKILIHSNGIADVAMVAEVVTALCYPFTWSLPYIPVLPVDMLEFIEAPLSYLLGIPTSSLKLVDPAALEDVVVVDLDKGISSTVSLAARNATKTKHPTPLPASCATNISKAVYKLLRAEEEVEEEFGGANYNQEESFPRLETESLAEREFRISVAVCISSLLRGYAECVGPVFNRDKFLKIAPALYEERRDVGGTSGGIGSRGLMTGSRVLSPRSKRFLALLVNTQNFHQLLESLESDDSAFFHEIMDYLDEKNDPTSRTNNANALDQVTIEKLTKGLQKIEDKIPTYRVEKGNGLSDVDEEDLFFDDDEGAYQYDAYDTLDPFQSGNSAANQTGRNLTSSMFTQHLLSKGSNTKSSEKQVSWIYNQLFDIPVEPSEGREPPFQITEKVKLRDAIGEKRYRAWKKASELQQGSVRDLGRAEDAANAKQGEAIDLTSLITSATDDLTEISSLASSVSSLRENTLSPEQQRVVDAKNRDVVRRCLDRAHDGRNPRYHNVGPDGTINIFLDHSRDLLVESEKAMHSPSTQRFLLSVLAQRSKLEQQRHSRTKRRVSDAGHSTFSRLDEIAFDCLVRLSCAMLDSCMEYKEYEAAYRLLSHTAGFVMVEEEEDEDEPGYFHRHIISMTTRIGLHPIFGDLGLWQTVMQIHVQERMNEKAMDKKSFISSGYATEEDEEEDDLAYEAAVATLYEMLGYAIPGVEMFRFATRASEENGWFCDDRGKQLLMLARRICVRRDQAEAAASPQHGDIDMVRTIQEQTRGRTSSTDEELHQHEHNIKWESFGWCHPAAPTSHNALTQDDHDPANRVKHYMKRAPVTALARFGSNAFVSGGLDGSVFLVHKIVNEEEQSSMSDVRGIHLDWGSASRAHTGTSSDGDYGVGAVSCIAAAHGAGSYVPTTRSSKDVVGDSAVSDDEMLAIMEGSRVIAGTTAGDLRVWSVRDVYQAVLMTKASERGVRAIGLGSGNAATRLKFSLRGRALSGHRGGVTCIEVPSHVYRPDSLVTGGADGLIKLWSLRAPTGGRRANASEEDGATQQPRGRGGDALSVLSGHSGRVMCIKTSWHGDRLLSGGADRTIRVWDLGGNGGKAIHTLTGHSGWITKLDYWGPNTIVSASSDRSVSLWDARVHHSPLFTLRHHHAPVSDILIGSRTDPMMVSASTDGIVATWDFRNLSASVSGGSKKSTNHIPMGNSGTTVRQPTSIMKHGLDGKTVTRAGSVFLSRGIVSPNTVVSTGADGVLREYDISTGALLNESPTGHCDAVSSFCSFGEHDGADFQHSNHNPMEGLLTSSWDGTVRIRKLVREGTN